MNNTWQEVKDAVNRVIIKLNPSVSGDWVDSCGGTLPFCMTQVMAMALAHEMYPENSEDVKVIVNGYRQLEDKGYIGDRD